MAFGVPSKIEVKYDDETVQKMLSLLKAAPLPDQPPVEAEGPWKLGIDLAYLKMLKDKFLTEWSWRSLEKKIAKVATKRCSVEEVQALQKELADWMSADKALYAGGDIQACYFPYHITLQLVVVY